MILEWLDYFGDEDYDGNGARRVFFSKQSIRRMERAFGCAPVRKLSEWFDVYKVEDSSTSDTITVGHRFQRLRRK